MLTLALSSVLALATSTFVPAETIPWQKSWEEAKELAARHQRILFVAVNMDGERANDRLATKVYEQKEIVALAKQTVCVVASAAEHASGDKPCSRFDGITCLDHRRIDTTLRKELLKPDKDGYVVAPQHVFLDSKGAVILSVPYDVTPDELTWCFVTAMKKVDEKSAPPMPASAHRPRLLIQDGVLDPAQYGAVQKPPTRAELLELLKEIKKTAFGFASIPTAIAVLSSDEPEALDFARQELRSSLNRLMGGGAGGGRGGGRGGGVARGNDSFTGNRAALIMHGIGAVSPRAYWEVVVEFLGDNDPELRAEAAVALEQLAAPESVRAIQAAIQKSKEPEFEKDLLRALGTAGANDKGARSTLLKRIQSEKVALLKLNAIVAAGSLAPGDDLTPVLEGLLASSDHDERVAAACAMAMSRDERYTSALEKASKDESDADLAAAAKSALEVLRTGYLKPIREPLKRVCQDKIDRERFFGRVDLGKGK